MMMMMQASDLRKMIVVSGVAATAGLGYVPTADGQDVPQQDCSDVFQILVVEEQKSVSFIDNAAMNSDGRVIITVTEFGVVPFGDEDVTRILQWDIPEDPDQPANPTENVRLATDDEDVQFLRYIFSATINDFNDIIFSGFSDTPSDTWNVYGLDEDADPSDLDALLDFSNGQPTLLGELSLLNNPPADRRFVYWTETSVNGDSEFCITLFEDGSTEDLVCTSGGTEIGRPVANDAGDVYYRQRVTTDQESAARAPLPAGRRQAVQAQNDIEQTIDGLTAEDDEVTLCSLLLSQGLLTGPSVNSAGNVAFFAGGPCSPGDPDEGGIYFYDAAANELQLVVNFEEDGLLPLFEIRSPFLNDANRIAFVARDAADPAIHSIYIYNPANDPEDRVIQLNDEALPDFQRIILGYVAVGDEDRVLYLGRNGQGQQTLFLATGCEVTINPDPCPADLNGDGVVDIDDLFILLANWSDPGEQCSDCDNCVGDLNDSCSIDVDDLFILLAAWGDCPVTACGQPQAGSCCEANDTPYCDDQACCDLVCNDDPFCCDTEWDELCAEAAIEMCAVCDLCPEDLNGDGVVDIDDKFILLGAWGPCDDPDDCPADLDGNGEVDIDDLFILLGAWGDCPDTPLACVPEWDVAVGDPGLRDGGLLAMTAFDGALVVGGWFTSAGEHDDAQGFAWWDGSQWHLPTWINGLVSPVLGDNDFFIETTVLRSFSQPSGKDETLAFAMSAFLFDVLGADTLTFIGLLPDLDDEPELIGFADEDVADMEIFFDAPGNGAALYASGRFTEIDGVETINIARWDGDWSQPFSVDFGIPDPIFSTMPNLLRHEVDGEEALFFSHFTIAASGEHNVIGMWDGSEVTVIGYVQGQVWSLEVFDGELHIGGDFSEVFDSVPGAAAGGSPGVQANNVARWDGIAWSALDEGLDIRVFTFGVLDDGTGAALYAGGTFIGSDEDPVRLVRRWDGQSWSTLNDTGPFNSGSAPRVSLMEVFDDGLGEGLYIGGSFTSIFVNGDEPDQAASGLDEVEVGQIAAWRCLDDIDDGGNDR